MLPSVINTLLLSLPLPDDIHRLLPKLRSIREILQSASTGGRSLTASESTEIVSVLDQALSAWQQKKQASSQFNNLCGLSEVARGLNIAIRTLQAELEGRLVTDAVGLIQQIKSNLLGTGSLLEIPPRQLELMYQVLEPVVLRMTAGKLTPPLQRSLADEALATMSDEALESLPAEDNVISATRRLINSILRFSKAFQQPSVELELSRLDQLVAELHKLVDCYQRFEATSYDICELIHDHRLLDTKRLKEKNHQYFEYLFPTEIITLEPTEEMQGAWRSAGLERQIKADMDVILSDCIRSHPVANALMAQYAQTKDLKLYEEARQLVLPEARKKLEVRLATAILNKATDEVEQKEAIHRYPVEITQELKSKISAGDMVGAMQVIEVTAIDLMKHFLPELYLNRFNIEQ